MDFTLLAIIVIVIVVLFAVIRSMRSHQGGSTQTSNQTHVSTKKAQIAQDIKATQTSRVVDAISVLEELSASSPNYRQYTELVGATQATSSVTAPYSKREVAYYDLRCFRVENIGGQNVETLIAHEKSIEPFYFNDGTSEKHVYVDLESFGDNIILVNSANRIEGPDSDFAKALGNIAGSSGTPNGAYAITGALRDKAERLSQTLRDRLPHPELAFEGFGAIGIDELERFASSPARRYGAHPGFTLMSPGMGGPGPGHRPGHGPGFGSGAAGFKPNAGFPGGSFDVGNFGNLGSFLGGMSDLGKMGNIGGPYGGHWDRNNDAGEMLLGMGLGALLGSLAAQSSSQQYAPVTPQSQFRGYRIVEDVVPLNYMVYALGEIYMNGGRVTIAKSTSASYPSSFFATKPEAEVISHLSGQ